MTPIRIAYTQLGKIGTVSGSIERTTINGDDCLVSNVIIHDAVESKSSLYITSFGKSDEEVIQEHIIRTKYSIMKHASRQYGTIVYESQLQVFGSVQLLVDDLHKRMGEQLNMPAYDKKQLYTLLQDLTKHFLNP